MKLAVIATFHGRRERTPELVRRVLVESTRRPDETWFMCEDYEDAAVVAWAMEDLGPISRDGVKVVVHPTPRRHGQYAVIPYSHKINSALGRTEADVIVYLDNNSTPAPTKFEAMLTAMEEHPWWGAAFCTQLRTGHAPALSLADRVVHDAWCVLNYTQVMHRRTDDRWTEDMAFSDPDIADAMFWRSLHASIGPFFPAGGQDPLDEHHIPSPRMSA